MLDMQELADQTLSKLADYVRRSVTPVLDRLRKLEDWKAALPTDLKGKDGSNGVDGKDGAPGARGEDGSNGRDGVDGKDVQIDVVKALVSGAVAERVMALPLPKDGRDGKDGADVDPAVIVAEVQRAAAALPKPRDGADGAAGKDADPAEIKALVIAAVFALPPARDGLNGKDGMAGADGKDAAFDHEALRVEVTRAVGAIPKPANGQDGKDGPAGKDGRDGADGLRGDQGLRGERGEKGQDVDPAVIDAMVQKRFDEQFPAMFEKAMDARMEAIVVKTAALVPPGRDGLPGAPGRPGVGENGLDGRDGKDGLGLDDIGVELKDGRTLVMRMRNAERSVTREVHFPGMPIDRGVFKSGQAYEAGDGVTYGGSYWFAKQDTTEPPKGDGNHWRLAVKGSK